MQKHSSLFNLLFIIVLLDNIVSALTVPVIMQILYSCDNGDSCQTIGISDNTIFLSGYIMLLSPTYLFATPIIGRIADIYGRKAGLLICLLLSSVGYLLLLIANSQQNILMTLIATLLLNAGTSSTTPVQAVVADISQGPQKAYLFGRIAFVIIPVYLVMAEAGKFCLGFFHTSFDIRSLLIVVALVVTLVNLLLLNLSPIAKLKPTSLIQQTPTLTLTESATIFTRPIIMLLIVFALFEFGTSWYFENMTDTSAGNLYFNIHGFPVILYYKVLIMIFSLFVIYPILLRKYNNNQLLFFCLLACCVGLLGCSFAPHNFVQWIFITLFTVGEIIFIPTVWCLLSDSTSANNQGLIMGIKSSVWALAWSLGVIADTKVNQVFSPYFSAVVVNILVIGSLVLTKYSLTKSLSMPRD